MPGGWIDEHSSPAFLDEHASALSFFSEAGLGHYLPVYVVADVRGTLQRTDPLFRSIHGFFEVDLEVPTRAGWCATARVGVCSPGRAATAH